MAYTCTITSNNNATSTVWYYWNAQCTTSTGATSIWPVWVNQCTTSAISTSNVTNTTIWPIWCSQSGPTTNLVFLPQPVERTPEQVEEDIRRHEERLAESRRQNEIYRFATEERAKERRAFEAKAMELLKDNLSGKQLEALHKHGWFLVEGGKSKKTYRIDAGGYSGNITHIDGKKEIERFCVHASHEIPLGDHILAQMLNLLWDEDYIIGKANKTRLAAA